MKSFDPSRPLSVDNIPERPLRTIEVAAITGFSKATVRNYISAGELDAIQAGPQKGFRIPAASVRKFLNRYNDSFGK